MSRPLRLEFAGALYHVTSRGNDRKAIFLDDADYETFLSLLAEACRRFKWVVHTYCLMTDHYHIVVETPDGNLSRGMRHLNGVYTQRFNSKHLRAGHLFQGRYKAILVDKDKYLLELGRYVLLNPVRARMVDRPEDWRWSSYPATIGTQKGFEGLAADAMLLQFGKQRNRAIERFREFVSEGAGQAIWLELKQQIYLGDKSFVERHIAHQQGKQSEVPLKQRRKPVKELDEFHASHASVNDAIVAAYQSGGYTMNEIAIYFGCHYSTVSRVLAKCKT